ncbi:MAG: xanthine dehydrogenase family protein molybdopterin-binding subunit, partial [Mycobacterium sp.]
MSRDSNDALIGASIPRIHDERLLRGDGWYVDDIDDAGTLHVAFVRSPVAHGRVNRFDAAAAVAGGEAVLVLGPDEVAELTNPLPTFWRIPGQHLDVVELAIHTVRYVGQPIGLVVARSRAIAEDVAELVKVDVEPLPLVAGVDAALAEGAPLVYPEIGTNVAGEIHFGDPVEDLEEALAAAPHVVERVFGVQRVCHSPMEPRGVLAEWNRADQTMAIWLSSQGPHFIRLFVGGALGIPETRCRVISPDVGGGFGAKISPYPEDYL